MLYIYAYYNYAYYNYYSKYHKIKNNQLYYNIIMQLPYIIILLGATGSGKTTLAKKTIEYLKLKKRHVKIIVDNLIMHNKRYKKLITEIIKNEDNDYLNPDANLLAKFNNAYFSVRKGPNCIPGNNLSCDEQSDIKLYLALAERKNVIIETTGTYYPKWLLTNQLVDNYNIIFSYSLVNYNILQQRNKDRLISSIKMFKEKKVKAAPRLPDISDKTFIPIIQNIKDTLLDTYNKCVQSYNINYNYCGNYRIKTMLLFDNNGKEMKLIFDSSFSNNLNKLIDKYFNCGI